MTAFVVPTTFQNIDKAFEIRIDVSMRMIDRMPHAGLSREVDHHRKAMFSEQRSHQRTIREIGLQETEPRIRAQDLQSCQLQRRIIVTVEIVQTDNVTAFGRQLVGDVKADKARRARDQYCLIRHRNPKVSVRLRRSGRSLFTRRITGVAIPSWAPIARSALKPYQGGEVLGARRRVALF